MEKINDLVEEHRSIHFDRILDHTKFNFYSIVHHSTAIEGSTLTELDTALLLDNDIVTNRSLFHDHLMVRDHYQALLFTLDKAQKKQQVTVSLIKDIAGLVMKNTGRSISTYGGGRFDESIGDLRTVSVRAGSGPNYLKPEKVAEELQALCDFINEQSTIKLSIKDQLILSFDSHQRFETIHPFGDGNGRTGRLLMNYLQFYFDLPPGIIRKESKREYIEALVLSRNENNDLTPIRNFLTKEYINQLREEINEYKRDNAIPLDPGVNKGPGIEDKKPGRNEQETKRQKGRKL